MLNVSANCVQSPHVAVRNFLRIPAVDNFGEQLLPHFATAFAFLGTVYSYDLTWRLLYGSIVS